ncbi:unnamed protein product [Heterobilharzia americana]|nr:unnamed protein product [Heterobilharzia americana]CAH8442388.1 unnamed protein product [Heterobilharzia americana]
MNRLFWAGVGCTLLLSIICSFNILNAAPNEKPVPRPGGRPQAKPAAAPAKPAAAPAKPAAAPSRKKIGLIAASSLPVAFGVLGEMMAQILHYIAS